MNIINFIREKLKTRLFKNVSWIFFGNLAHSILNFILGIFITRKISLYDNGVLTYAGTYLTFFGNVAGLGFYATMTREFAKDKENSGTILASCMAAKLMVSVIAIVAIQVIIRAVNPGEPVLYIVSFIQSFTLITGTFDQTVYWFRYEGKSNVVAILRLIAFGFAAIGRALVIFVFEDLYLYVGVSISESVLFSTFLAITYFKEKPKNFHADKKVMITMIKHSYPFLLSSLLITIYGKADSIMIKLMIDTESVALYQVACHFATLIATIPSTLIEGFRPEIMDSKVKDENLFKHHFRQLYGITIWMSLAYCIVVSIFSKTILHVCYGDKYLAAANTLSLTVWYSTFSYMGPINNLYMIAEGKGKFVTLNTFIGALTNLVLNFILIPRMGIDGAALATLLTQFVTNFATLYIFKPLRPCAQLMREGIALKAFRGSSYE